MSEVTIKPTKEQLKKLKKYWKKLRQLEDAFGKQIRQLEEQAEKELGIDIQFFMCDNDYVGIGNYSRTMNLIQTRELEN